MPNLPPDGPPLSTKAASDLQKTLAHHDAAIVNLASRMTGVESKLESGFTTVGHAMTSMSSKLDKLDAAPRLDFHKSVSTVLALAVLFSMVVGGIIWVTTSQWSGLVAKQEATNALYASQIKELGSGVSRNDTRLDSLQVRIGWQATNTPKQ